jgi:hypothetical protein
MRIDEVVSEVVNITKKFSLRDDVSIYQLLKDSGYFENYFDISIYRIKKELEFHPELVQFWINYSEDKRTSGGWYFKKDNNTFKVGNLIKKSEMLFIDSADACAVFIKNEIEEIRE